MTRLGAAGKEPVLSGAVARVHLRRNVGPYAMRRLRSYLRRRARGAYALARWGEWIIVDLASDDDCLALRRRFPTLIDGWRAFP